MLLALFAFRRGAGVATLCVALLMPPLLLSPDVAHAQSNAPAGTLWRRADQIAAARMEAGEAAYRSGDFAGATSAYDGIPVADAHYNLGNALAKQGRYDDAIAAYDAALRAQPGMPDALANKRAVEAAKKRKPPPGQGQRKDPRAQGKQQDGKPSQSQADAKAQQQPSPKNAQQPPQPSQQQPPAPSQSQPDTPADAQSQRAADAAQRARMQQALEKQGKQDPASAAAQARARKETPAERERRLANEAWLRRVPDDPGSLLRAKFRLEYERRQLEGGE
jgi:Ca-activated chloride channel family protein